MDGWDLDTAIPKFRDNKDRLVFLLAEYKWPILVVIVAAGVWWAAVDPRLPTPTQRQVTFATIWGALAFPLYFVGIKISRYLWPDDRPLIGVCDPGTQEIYTIHKVPKNLWQSRTERGATPLEPDGGACDYVVTRFQYYEDLDELEVRGVDKADMTPAEATRYSSRVDEYYEYHHQVRRAYSTMKATVSRYATEIHDATIMTMTSEREETELAPGVNPTDLIEEMEEEIGDLPEGPANEPPDEPLVEKEFGALDPGEIPEPEQEETNGHKPPEEVATND